MASNMVQRGEYHLKYWWLCVFVLGISVVEADVQSQVFCDGDVINLRCQQRSVLSVYGVFYRVLEPGSQICKHVNASQSPCHPLQISRVVRMSCQGKSECLLPSKPIGDNGLDCLKSLYLTILFDCGQPKVAVSPEPKEKEKSNETLEELTSTPSLVVTVDTKLTPTQTDRKGKSRERDEPSYFSFFFWTLFSAAMAVDYIQARPRHVILCVILSASTGIVILIVAVLLMACYQRIKEKKQEESESNIDISAPITRTMKENEDPAVQECDALISNENPVAPSINAEERAPEVKVECTREPVSKENSVNQAETVDGSKDLLSEKEAKELGHLVEIMRFYNSKLSSSQHSLPQLKDIAEMHFGSDIAEKPCNKVAKKSHTLPRRGSKDELDELFQQLSTMSPVNYAPETFDNIPESGALGLYENLNSPTPTTSTPKYLPNLDKQDGRQHSRNAIPSNDRGETSEPSHNLPANYAYLEKSASDLLKELSDYNNDNDFLSSRSSSQTSEVPCTASDARFSTFHTGRGSSSSGNHYGPSRPYGTLDRLPRNERPDGILKRDHGKISGSQAVASYPEPQILNSGMVRHRSDLANHKAVSNSHGTLGYGKRFNDHEVPLTTFPTRIRSPMYDSPRARDIGHYQYPPANSPRIRIIQHDF